VSDSEALSRLHGKDGVRFFGDIHGCRAEFGALAEDALARNLHLHSLGDLINRGPDSPGCMRLACDLHDAGWLDLNPGNHDERFARWVKGEPVPVKPNGLGSTLAQLQGLPDREALAWRFFRLLMQSRLWTRFGRIYAVHAALHQEMLGRDGPVLAETDAKAEWHRFALEGELRQEADPERWELGRRSFRWLDRVPAGVTVMIGHSVASTDGLRERRNAAGGRIVHLDTGLQRGGPLSYIDVPMAVIECLHQPAIAAFPQVSDLEIRATRASKLKHSAGGAARSPADS
jgi:protein phosphatase